MIGTSGNVRLSSALITPYEWVEVEDSPFVRQLLDRGVLEAFPPAPSAEIAAAGAHEDGMAAEPLSPPAPKSKSKSKSNSNKESS